MNEKTTEKAIEESSQTQTTLSRRTVLGSATGLAALSLAGCDTGNSNKAGLTAASESAPQAPFDSVRDYIAALDANGLLLEVDEVDQDKYLMTGMFFKATDKYSMYGAPAMKFNRIKIDGQWVDGPVYANYQGHWNTDAIIWGLKPVPGDHFATYRNAREYMKEMLIENGGRYPEIAPIEVDAATAPCKEIKLTGDQIDITKFAFIKTNPADGGRYVNTGSVFTSDPEMGLNFGTYRCMINGPRSLGFNPEPNQTADKMMKRAIARGETTAPISIVIGQDPYIWMVSGSRVAPRPNKPIPINELAVAGGMRGKAIEVVKSETNDMPIPAHAEMIIEGLVRLDQSAPEGPFGEMFGYLGPYKEKNYVIEITSITHRKNPWIMNAFTGMQRGMVTAPMDALYSISLAKSIPGFIEYTNFHDMMGVIVVSIEKTEAGQGLNAGMAVARRNPIAKVVIVVDSDINILDKSQVLFAMGSRWQPYPASAVIEDTWGLQTDPSQVEPNRTSKIVIDATRQLAAEGGRAEFPKTNRALLEQGAPGVMDQVDQQLGQLLDNWREV